MPDSHAQVKRLRAVPPRASRGELDAYLDERDKRERAWGRGRRTVVAGNPCGPRHHNLFLVFLAKQEWPRSGASLLSTRRGDHTRGLFAFELDLSPDGLELLLELLGFLVVCAFLDGLRRIVHQFLGFLEAQPGDCTDFLDDFNLFSADIG